MLDGCPMQHYSYKVTFMVVPLGALWDCATFPVTVPLLFTLPYPYPRATRPAQAGTSLHLQKHRLFYRGPTRECTRHSAPPVSEKMRRIPI